MDPQRCRHCGKRIFHEIGEIGRRPELGWSDRHPGGDSLVCFKALNYRHTPKEE